MENRRRRGYLILAAAVAVILACGAVFAYMYHKSGVITDSFTASTVDCDVTEVFDSAAGVKSAVAVTNTGDTDAYIRVKLVSNWVDPSGAIVGEQPPALSFTMGGRWIKKGDVYYYTDIVKAGESTEDLLGSSITLAGKDGLKQSVEVMAEAVQADPADAVKEAWKVDIVNGKIR